ncbi:MAG: glycoside hydrolase family 5 protein [Bacteroidota bacterium]
MFSITKGINLSHWLSQFFGWSPKDVFVTKNDIAYLKNIGFDHVRLPIDEEQMFHENGMFNQENLSYLHSCIKWCLEEDMRVVVDLHILRSHHFNAGNNEGAMTLWNNPKDQDTMIDIWRKLSSELSSYSTDMVAYEFMNEPVAPKHSMWNTLVARGHTILRALEPNRTLIFGPNMWQFPRFFKYFEIPANDSNIILSFHTYDPLPFTHYKAYWMPLGKYSGPVQYPGSIIPEKHFPEFEKATKGDKVLDIVKDYNEFSRKTFVSIVSPAIDFAKKHGMQLYCNEFGCLPSVPTEDRIRYFKDIISVFSEYDIAYASWDYKGDFGIVEWDRETYTNKEEDSEIIKILTQK